MAEPGQTVLRVIKRIDGASTTADGQFVVRYDPTITDGTFTLVTSADSGAAVGFSGIVEAVRYLRQVSPNVPVANGQPNRPLTAFTVELMQVPFHAL